MAAARPGIVREAGSRCLILSNPLIFRFVRGNSDRHRPALPGFVRGNRRDPWVRSGMPCTLPFLGCHDNCDTTSIMGSRIRPFSWDRVPLPRGMTIRSEKWPELPRHSLLLIFRFVRGNNAKGIALRITSGSFGDVGISSHPSHPLQLPVRSEKRGAGVGQGTPVRFVRRMVRVRDCLGYPPTIPCFTPISWTIPFARFIMSDRGTTRSIGRSRRGLRFVRGERGSSVGGGHRDSSTSREGAGGGEAATSRRAFLSNCRPRTPFLTTKRVGIRWEAAAGTSAVGPTRRRATRRRER
jgi:hypothetical protein